MNLFLYSALIKPIKKSWRITRTPLNSPQNSRLELVFLAPFLCDLTSRLNFIAISSIWSNHMAPLAQVGGSGKILTH